MPAFPEVADGQSRIRVVEVFEQLESEHRRKTDRHVRVAGKIEIQLYTIGEGSRPSEQAGRRRGFERGACDKSRGIRYQHLFRQPENESAHAERRAVERDLSVRELVAYVVIFNDGTGDQLREEGYVQKQVEEARLCFGLAGVYVNGV